MAFALVVSGDRGGLRDLLLARAGQRLGEVGPGRFDGGALLVELPVDRRRFELHEELPGGDVLPFIDEDADDAAAGERPHLHRARLERSGEDDLLWLALGAPPHQRGHDQRRQHENERDAGQQFSCFGHEYLQWLRWSRGR